MPQAWSLKFLFEIEAKEMAVWKKTQEGSIKYDRPAKTMSAKDIIRFVHRKLDENGSDFSELSASQLIDIQLSTWLWRVKSVAFAAVGIIKSNDPAEAFADEVIQSVTEYLRSLFADPVTFLHNQALLEANQKVEEANLPPYRLE